MGLQIYEAHVAWTYLAKLSLLLNITFDQQHDLFV